MTEDGGRNDELESANAQLNASLKHCRELVSQFRSKLIANQDEPPVEGFSAKDGKNPVEGTRPQS